MDHRVGLNIVPLNRTNLSQPENISVAATPPQLNALPAPISENSALGISNSELKKPIMRILHLTRLAALPIRIPKNLFRN